tara:strand:+ start:425 stop:589 length:165 start_codon:yes stop_codon:yes gene_type:complete
MGVPRATEVVHDLTVASKRSVLPHVDCGFGALKAWAMLVAARSLFHASGLAEEL